MPQNLSVCGAPVSILSGRGVVAYKHAYMYSLCGPLRNRNQELIFVRSLFFSGLMFAMKKEEASVESNL